MHWQWRRIVRRNDDTAFAVEHRFSISSHIRHDHRQTRSHSFENGIGEALLVRAKHPDVAGVQDLQDVVAGVEEQHLVGRCLVRQPAPVAMIRSLRRGRRSGAARQTWRGPTESCEQIAMAFVGDEISHDHQRERLRTEAQRRITLNDARRSLPIAPGAREPKNARPEP